MTSEQVLCGFQELNPVLQEEVKDFIEFLLTKQDSGRSSAKPQFGMAKGRFQMSEDFDAPLEDLNQYM